MTTLLTPDEIESLLQARIAPGALKRLGELQPPEQMLGVTAAAERIAAAIKNREPIAVVGDYDVDGVCAAAILSDGLKRLGGRAESILPCRFKDGYGLSPALADRIEASLVVTVDNGIAACEAARVLKARGQDLIITDHHQPPAVLPEALAIINPKLRECGFGFDQLCGATVAWYLLAGVKAKMCAPLDMAAYLEWMVLAILADAVPLVGPNRLLAIHGLSALNRSERPFVQALRRFFERRTFDYDAIAFQIAPRLNAAGRMADAQLALAFLLAEDVSHALTLWQRLDALNTERKGVQNRTIEAALLQHEPDDPAAVVWEEGWHEGVSGIVAARLAEQLQKPAIVFALKGDRAKGSARGVGECDLYALIAQASEHLIGFGGHRKAAGLIAAKEALAPFKAAFLRGCAYLGDRASGMPEGVIGAIKPEAMSLDLARRIARYEPFGEANAKPLFWAEDFEIRRVRRLGSGGEHLKLEVAAHPGAPTLEAISFFNDRPVEIEDRVSFFYALEINRFRERESVQLVIDRFS